jgi:hypothetical protein
MTTNGKAACIPATLSCPMDPVPDAPPLKVTSTNLVVRKMGQSTPYPGAINTLTVTLRSDIPLLAASRTISDGTVIMIMNMEGASAPNGDLGVASNLGLSGSWNNATKQASFTVLNDIYGTLVLSFNVTNTIYPQV